MAAADPTAALALRGKSLGGQQRAVGEHGAAAQRHVVGQGQPDRRQRHRAHDGQSRAAAPWPARCHGHRVPDPLAELAQGGDAQLDLAWPGDRVAAGGRGLHRAQVPGQPQHGQALAVDGDLGEREGGPAGDPRLAADEPVHLRRRPALVPTLAVHQQRPVPAVPGRVGDQPGQAGAEHHRHRHGHDRHYGTGQGSQHGNRSASAPRSSASRVPTTALTGRPAAAAAAATDDARAAGCCPGAAPTARPAPRGRRAAQRRARSPRPRVAAGPPARRAPGRTL